MSLRVVDMLGGYWEERAACKGEPTWVFFPEVAGQRTDYGHALAICAGCPVKADCLEFALADEHIRGVWGGATEADRHDIRKQRAASARARGGRNDRPA